MSWRDTPPPDILETLLALADSGYWGWEQFSAWAEKVAGDGGNAPTWLFDLVFPPKDTPPEDVLRAVLVRDVLTLDFDRIYLMAMGFALLAWRAGDVTAQEARAYCFDLADAYSPAGFDVSDFLDPDLKAARFLPLREAAEDGLATLTKWSQPT